MGTLKDSDKKRGSALVLTLLLLSLMLILVLYYVSLIRLESLVADVDSSESESISALELGVSQALSELEQRHRDRIAEEKVSLSPEDLLALVSSGEGEAVTSGWTLEEVEELGWPNAQGILDQLLRAEWVVEGDETEKHTAYAWAVIPLTGTLDPEGLDGEITADVEDISGWDTSHLLYDPASDSGTYFSSREFRDQNPDALPVFVPGSYSRDRGWFDFTTSTWQTNVVVGVETLSMNPFDWTDAGVEALFEELYPDRDFAGLAQSFLDFRDGNPVPTNPDGPSAVAVPQFNELTASMTVRSLGDDKVEIAHQVDIEIWNIYPSNLQTNTFEVAVTPSLVAREPDSDDVTFDSQPSDTDWTFEAPGGDVENAFAVLTLNVLTPPITKIPGEVLEVDWDFGNLELEMLAEGVADRLPEGLRLVMPGVTVPPSGGVVRVEATLEVKDPGLNYLTDMWVTAVGPSLSAVNQAAIDAAEAEEVSDGWTRWFPHVHLDNVSEPFTYWSEGVIGYFPLDTPWRSVDLFSETGQWWLRHTRAPGWQSGEWTRSCVNPNSLYEDALSAIFTGVTATQLPFDTGGETVDEVLARKLAEEFSASVQLDEPFVQRGDWSVALEAALLEEFPDRHQAESVIDSTLTRMETGYQLYALLVFSEQRLPGGRTRSQKAEAIVLWVDPLPNESGRHEMIKLLRFPLSSFF